MLHFLYSYVVNFMKLNVLKRTNEKIKALRDDNYIPAIIYGNSEFISEPIKIKIKSLDFKKVFEQCGYHALVDVFLDDLKKEPFRVIVKDLQRHSVNDSILHVDFYCVNMDKDIVVDLPLSFVGISPAVKKLGAIFVKHSDTVKIKCLPSNLLNKIDVDISFLKNLNDSFCFKDLKLPDNIKLISDKNRIIANTTIVKKVVETKQEVDKPEEKAEDKEGAKEPEKKEEKK